MAYNKKDYKIKILKQLQLKDINTIINNKTVEKIDDGNYLAISSNHCYFEIPRPSDTAMF